MADRDPMMPPRGSARRSDGDRLNAALQALAGHRAQTLDHREQPWASVTFTGTRHQLTLLFAGAEAVAAGEEFIAALDEHEFTIPNRLVADAVVSGVDHRVCPDPRLVVHCEVLLLQHG